MFSGAPAKAPLYAKAGNTYGFCCLAAPDSQRFFSRDCGINMTWTQDFEASNLLGLIE
jgi:hypothetical protein